MCSGPALVADGFARMPVLVTIRSHLRQGPLQVSPA